MASKTNIFGEDNIPVVNSAVVRRGPGGGGGGSAQTRGGFGARMLLGTPLPDPRWGSRPQTPS